MNVRLRCPIILKNKTHFYISVDRSYVMDMEVNETMQNNNFSQF